MGADLYANGYEKFRKQWEKQHQAEWDALVAICERSAEVQARIEALDDSRYPVEMYFRDSYNPSSIMARLGLSWWRDVIPMLHKRKHINASPDVCRKLAEMVGGAPLTLLTLAEYEKDFGKGSTLDEWNAYFVEKKAALVRFLRICANEGGCYMSL